jgi:hypothetical protein
VCRTEGGVKESLISHGDEVGRTPHHGYAFSGLVSNRQCRNDKQLQGLQYPITDPHVLPIYTLPALSHLAWHLPTLKGGCEFVAFQIRRKHSSRISRHQ